jgi:pimeloyl-ACP methyl ester carboxylesterase
MIRLLLTIVATALFTAAAQAAAPASIFTDPPHDAAHPARMEVLHVPTGGVEINGVAYIASGEGTHPTLVICHGWPGNEKNLDLAQAVRRSGWNAVTFNYRGSWGSPGTFHFSQVPEDASAVVNWLRKPEVADKLGIDPRRIAIAGHSMGGWATALAASNDPQLIGAITISAADMGLLGKMSREEVIKEAADDAETLAGTSPEQMADELISHGDAFSMLRAASGLKKMPMLVLTSDDHLAAHSDALVAAVRAAGNRNIQTVHIATDHGYSDRRIALESAIIRWLQGLSAAH